MNKTKNNTATAKSKASKSLADDRTARSSTLKQIDHNKQKTKADLLEIAKRAGVTGRHAMTKDELQKAIDKKID